MSRLTIAPLLVTFGILPACGDADVDSGDLGDFAALEAEEDPDGLVGADAPSALGGPAGSTFNVEPVILAPILECGDYDCLPGGIGSVPLKGRNLLRAMYFDVVGYPDEGTYRSHASRERPATRGGAWASAMEEITRVNAEIANAGIAACGDVPQSQSFALLDARLEFSDGDRLVPSRFPYDAKRLEHHLEVTTIEHDLSGVVDFSCDFPLVYAELEFVLDDVPHHTKAYWSVTEGVIELELLSEIGPFLHAASLVADRNGVEGTLVSVVRQDGGESGIRTVFVTDAESRAASAFHQAFDYVPQLSLKREAFDVTSKGGEAESFQQCASYSPSAEILVEGACPGLEYSPAPESSFESDTEYSIGWVAQPIGLNGMLDILEKDL